MCARCLRPLGRVVLPSSATSSVLCLPPVRRSCTVDARGTETASTLSRSATSHVTNTSASSSCPRARVGASVNCFIISFYPFLEVAALMDLLYISRSSAVRPILQTLAPSSPPHPSPKVSGLHRFLWPSTLPSSINFSSVWCIFVSPK